MNSLEVSVSNMDFAHTLFSESRYPLFGLQLEQHTLLLLLALLNVVDGCRAHCK